MPVGKAAGMAILGLIRGVFYMRLVAKMAALLCAAVMMFAGPAQAQLDAATQLAVDTAIANNDAAGLATLIASNPAVATALAASGNATLIGAVASAGASNPAVVSALGGALAATNNAVLVAAVLVAAGGAGNAVAGTLGAAIAASNPTLVTAAGFVVNTSVPSAPVLAALPPGSNPNQAQTCNPAIASCS